MEINLAGNGTGRKILVRLLKPILRLSWDGRHGVKRNLAASFHVPWKKFDLFWILTLQRRPRDPGLKVLISGSQINPIQK